MTPLTDDVRKGILSALSQRPTSELTLHLSDLHVVVNFLLAQKSLNLDQSLSKYVNEIVSRPIDVIPQTVKLHQIISIWLLIKYQQAYQLKSNNMVSGWAYQLKANNMVRFLHY